MKAVVWLAMFSPCRRRWFALVGDGAEQRPVLSAGGGGSAAVKRLAGIVIVFSARAEVVRTAPARHEPGARSLCASGAGSKGDFLSHLHFILPRERWWFGRARGGEARV